MVAGDWLIPSFPQKKNLLFVKIAIVSIKILLFVSIKNKTVVKINLLTCCETIRHGIRHGHPRLDESDFTWKLRAILSHLLPSSRGDVIWSLEKIREMNPTVSMGNHGTTWVKFGVFQQALVEHRRTQPAEIRIWAPNHGSPKSCRMFNLNINQ